MTPQITAVTTNHIMDNSSVHNNDHSSGEESINAQLIKPFLCWSIKLKPVASLLTLANQAIDFTFHPASGQKDLVDMVINIMPEEQKCIFTFYPPHFSSRLMRKNAADDAAQVQPICADDADHLAKMHRKTAPKDLHAHCAVKNKNGPDNYLAASLAVIEQETEKENMIAAAYYFAEHPEQASLQFANGSIAENAVAETLIE